MRLAYAPGCALTIYKPRLAARVHDFLCGELGQVALHTTCCRYAPGFSEETQIINTCAGCDRRYRELYEGVSTVSLWEVLALSRTFRFPDYGGAEVAIQDACPIRTETRVHTAVRDLLSRMNIRVVEPDRTREGSICCGDSFYGTLPVADVREHMMRRAAQMPCEAVVVYCVSCIKAMHIGGKRPRYLVDLLYGEETEPGTFEPDEWHAQLERFIGAQEGPKQA